MKIGIIGAMETEIQMYLEHLQDRNELAWHEFTFYTGRFEGIDVVVAKSGVGKVFATMVAQFLITHFSVDKIIVSGVAGSLDPLLNIGDVILSKDCIHHDMDATPLFERGRIPYTDYKVFKADEGLLAEGLTAQIAGHTIKTGRILTGDQFFNHADKDSHPYLKDEFQGDCIEMEGAAIAQVCTVLSVPFLIVRTISDRADSDAAEDYNTFKDIVAHNSFQIIRHIVKRL
ncbi:5'-methylthioadenosine/adenosylhomocysteine nucleosidase [Candidatus Woesearchaeota archaeon]|nr:5'-methylthioadenosine/adenosylhomocysteine nucleosidase [Candidatus Woesearchaeota archaeon]